MTDLNISDTDYQNICQYREIMLRLSELGIHDNDITTISKQLQEARIAYEQAYQEKRKVSEEYKDITKIMKLYNLDVENMHNFRCYL